jgi:hypothetical protein
MTFKQEKKSIPGNKGLTQSRAIKVHSFSDKGTGRNAERK